MIRSPTVLTVAFLIACSSTNGSQRSTPKPGNGWYRAALAMEDGGVELPFFLHIPQQSGSGSVVNAEEKLEVDVVWKGEEVIIRPKLSYDSEIRATRSADGSLVGEWDRFTPLWGEINLPFAAKPIEAPDPSERFGGDKSVAADFSGTWKVSFEKLGLGILQVKQTPDGVLRAYAQPHHYGDYQHLAGNVVDGALRLSTFDGTNLAIYMEAKLDGDKLVGRYNIADVWMEAFTATRENTFELPNRIRLKDGVETLDVQRLKEAPYAGKPVIFVAFATWCPGCNDARPLYKELYDRYHSKGLQILGHTYDLSEDQATNQEKIDEYKKAHGIPWEILPVAGTPETMGELAPFPQLDGMEALPVTIFIRRDGKVHAIHGGFDGPAAGDGHDRIRARFDQLAQEIVGS